ncbi:hypothetical protein EC957_000935 [Mortierella hygrophila]|uniref:cellulase n=1 Tax=Mortierella hygrophila TaxID=979708 RepID=A0A9P6K245_9FUNG|nr:hypothetical protein EC957_000935 [Mortierella hygrophila]
MRPSLCLTLVAAVALMATAVFAQEESPAPQPSLTPSPTPVAPTITTGSGVTAEPQPSATAPFSPNMPPIYPTEPLSTRDSPSFPDPEYVKLLDYMFLFYEAQRSGKLPADQRVTWRNDSALNDGKDSGLDLSGGYYDAGDYMKFIFPLTFTMTETCWGALEFWDGYQLANQTHYLDQMVRWGMDWLIKAHPNDNTLYVQVGLNEVDNNYWGPDSGIPLPRTSFKVTNTSPGTDVMADAAAAFAACSMLYRDKLKDTAYAATLQTHATSLFNVAETARPQQAYQKVVPAVTCCYESSGFIDELAWGAAWMYKLTQDASFATKADNYISQLNAGSVQTNTITWDDKSSMVYILMAGATPPALRTKWQGFAQQYADSVAAADKPNMFTEGGLFYSNGNSQQDSSVVAANAAFALQILANNMNATGNSDRDRIEKYSKFSLSQVEYLLGENPERTPYVVGVHPNSPANPHSAPASGGTDIDNINTSPSVERWTLYGALVGGPDKNDRFLDERDKWEQSEACIAMVALDYNAPFHGLMAHMVSTATSSPPYVTIVAGRPDLPPILNGMAVWQIILIVVGSIFVAVAIGAFVCYRKRDQIRAWAAARKQRSAEKSMPKYVVKRSAPPRNHNDRDVEALEVGRGQGQPTLLQDAYRAT